MDHVRAWVKTTNRKKYAKRNKITGEMEPIHDFRQACAAFVDTCRDMNIQR